MHFGYEPVHRDLFAEDMYSDMNTSLEEPGYSQVISNMYAEVLVLV